MTAVALAMLMPLGGCTHGKEQSQPVASPTAFTKPPNLIDPLLPGARLLVPPAPAIPPMEVEGVALDAATHDHPGGATGIIQTAGVFEAPADAVKQGVAKVSEAITPTTPVTPADDPTMLSTKAKPSPELHLSVARYHEEQGKPALAEQAYQQALRLSPKHLGAHLAYARFKQRQGQVQAAMQLYQKAAKYHPAEAAVYNDLGLLYAREGKNAEALAAFGRAVELQPRRALYRNNTAVLLVDIGQADQAIRHLMVVYPEADAFYKIGFLLQTKGQTHQAIASFSRAMALNPSMKEARVWLDHLQSQSGRGEPQIARRPPAPDVIVEPQPPVERPELRLRDDDQPASLSPDLDPVNTQRGAVRQLPPVLKPFPSPPAESPSGADAPGGPGLRRLPRTSAERPTSYQEDPSAGRNGYRLSDESAAAIPDAPLPPPSVVPMPAAPAGP